MFGINNILTDIINLKEHYGEDSQEAAEVILEFYKDQNSSLITEVILVKEANGITSTEAMYVYHHFGSDPILAVEMIKNIIYVEEVEEVNDYSNDCIVYEVNKEIIEAKKKTEKLKEELKSTLTENSAELFEKILERTINENQRY